MSKLHIRSIPTQYNYERLIPKIQHVIKYMRSNHTLGIQSRRIFRFIDGLNLVLLNSCTIAQCPLYTAIAFSL